MIIKQRLDKIDKDAGSTGCRHRRNGGGRQGTPPLGNTELAKKRLVNAKKGIKQWTKSIETAKGFLVETAKLFLEMNKEAAKEAKADLKKLGVSTDDIGDNDDDSSDDEEYRKKR